MNQKNDAIFYEKIYIYHPALRVIVGGVSAFTIPLFTYPLIALDAFSGLWFVWLIFDSVIFGTLGYVWLALWSLRQIAEVSDTGVRVRTFTMPPRSDETWTPGQIRVCEVIEILEDPYLGTWRISGYRRPKNCRINPGVILVFSEGGYQTFRSKRPQDFKEAVDSMKSEWLRAQ
ncbi:MAG: hypothetical protein BroJett018_49720 [Chloroflexota bacterium]|nr:hypothetical protein [Chloroflexota bacterium]NOG64420.1 hypothetical protein [Chloroflexota bacterium]GIK67178.1 MAG: hypothetical protein BroJett018_49720 [Chloroflexota bacterium]